MPRNPATPLLPCAEQARLIDHHCHGVLRDDVDRMAFEELLTEAGVVSRWGTTLFDSLIGLAVRRWCAPVLDLPELAGADDYLARRAELGATEVNRRFLRGSGIGHFLVDGGFLPEKLTGSAELAELSGAPVSDVLRLERLAEDVVRAGTTAASFASDVTALLDERARTAVALKSIAAYRVGLELSGERPSAAEVRAAAGDWLSTVEETGTVRLASEVLHRFLVWSGIDRGLPIQFHVGFGDADLDLHRCDPLLLTGLLRATRDRGVPIMLLHNYPFHRQAGYLAQVFEHVFVDVGLATHNAGHRAGALIAETLEITPFGKFLFSTDAFGLSEMSYLGSRLFRRGLSDFLRDGLDAGAWSQADAERLCRLAGADNAIRAYGLDDR